MSNWLVEVTIMPKDGVNDPQGEAVRGGLMSLEFDGVQNVRVGKFIAISLDSDTEQGAIEQATSMCEQLLANPVIEQYSITARVDSTTARENE